jgi:predicted DCC family thiol-disulfide oxidoreductase YuxK
MADQAAMGGVPALTILCDGGCLLCLREVRFLQGRDPEPHRLAFVDSNDPTYDPGRHAGISYRAAMGRIHAIDADGTVMRDVAVFRRAYGLIGLGWLHAPTDLSRLEQLCHEREGGGTPSAAAGSRCRI